MQKEMKIIVFPKATCNDDSFGNCGFLCLRVIVICK